MALSFSYTTYDLHHRFAGITYLDGTAIPPSDPESPYVGASYSYVGDSYASTGMLSAYHRLFSMGENFSLYAGAGVGFSPMRFTDATYAGTYFCLPGAVCEEDARIYTSFQLTDIEGTATSGHLFLGIDDHRTPRFTISLEGGYNSWSNTTEESGEYIVHTIEDLANSTTFSKITVVTMMMKVRYALDFSKSKSSKR